MQKARPPAPGATPFGLSVGLLAGLPTLTLTSTLSGVRPAWTTPCPAKTDSAARTWVRLWVIRLRCNIRGFLSSVGRGSQLRRAQGVGHTRMIRARGLRRCQPADTAGANAETPAFRFCLWRGTLANGLIVLASSPRYDV